MVNYYDTVVLRIDCDKPTPVVRAKQLDNICRILHIHFVDETQTEVQWGSDVEAEFRVQRPDGSLIVANGSVSSDLKTVIVELTEDMLEISGRAIADLRMKQYGGKVLSGGAFYIDILPTATGKDPSGFSGLTINIESLTKEQYESHSHNLNTVYLVSSEEAGEEDIEMYFGDSIIKTSSMTKEEILTAIVQVVESGSVGDIDTGFITTIKEQNRGIGLKFWVGTTEQYDSIVKKEHNVLYIKTDDTSASDINGAISELKSEITTLKSLGTTSKAGLCKIIADFNTPSGDQSGRALAASAGYVLAQQILTIQRVTTDSSWIDAEMSSGVSAISVGSQIQYRKIGNHVFVRGLVTFTMGSEALNLAALPADYRPQKNTYIYSPCQGARIAQIFANSSGEVSCDYIINLSDGSRYTGEIGWAQVNVDYFID